MDDESAGCIIVILIAITAMAVSYNSGHSSGIDENQFEAVEAGHAHFEAG